MTVTQPSGITSMKLAAAVLISLAAAQTILRCAQWKPPKDITYHFTAACKRSKMKAIAAISVANIKECQFWANKRRAFAFNFLHKDLLHPSVNLTSKENCIIFECPELDIRRFGQDSLYDYYSSYSHPAYTNVSCIPKVGVFQFHLERKNYEEAERKCDSEESVLADIGTDLHTTQLSSLLANLNVTSAYVGLKQWNETRDEYLTSRGLPLSCLRFRAWAPKEPRQINQTKCVVLTSKGFWRIRNCDRKFRFLCEVKPQGPYKPCEKFHNAERKRRCIKAHQSSLPRKNRNPKCGDPEWQDRRNRKSQRDTNVLTGTSIS